MNLKKISWESKQSRKQTPHVWELNCYHHHAFGNYCRIGLFALKIIYNENDGVFEVGMSGIFL